MQLKVCNPHLVFFFYLSVWSKDLIKCCAGDRCRFIKGLESPRELVLFYSNKKLKGEGKLQYVYISCEIIVHTAHQKDKKKLNVFFFSAQWRSKKEANFFQDFLHPCLISSLTRQNKVTYFMPQKYQPPWHARSFPLLLPLPFVFADTCSPISIFQPLRRREKQPNVCLSEIPFFLPERTWWATVWKNTLK